MRVSLLAVALGLTLTAAPALSDTLTARPGITIPAVLNDRVSSQDSAAGQEFHFTTAAPVRLGEWEVPAGTPGRGVVRSATPATSADPGELDLEATSLDVGAGATIAVTLAPDSATVRGPLYHTHVWPIPFPFGIGVITNSTRGDRNATLQPGAKLTLVAPAPVRSPAPGER